MQRKRTFLDFLENTITRKLVRTPESNYERRAYLQKLSIDCHLARLEMMAKETTRERLEMPFSRLLLC